MGGTRARRARNVLWRTTVAGVVLGAAAAVGVVADQRVTEQRREEALARAERTPAVTTVPAPLFSADLPLPPAPPAPDAPMPNPALVASTLSALWTDPALGPHVVALVVDAKTGQVLADRDGGVPAIPASNTKVLTAAAVLTAVPPTARIATVARAGVLPGDVVLVGGGDPTLSAAPDGQPTLYPNAARLAALAAQITASRAASAAGPVQRIIVDSTLFTGPTIGPDWAPDDAPSSYGAPAMATMVDGARDTPTAVNRSAAPDVAAGAALAALLGVPGVEVLRGQASPTAPVLGQVQSASMLDLVQQMLRDSDNVLAEALARQVAIAHGAPVSFAGAASATTAILLSLGLPGLDAAHFGLLDGSGLSPQNRIAPLALVAVLRAAMTDADHPALAGLLAGLPVAGWDGTLERRYRAVGDPYDNTLPGSAAAIDAAGVVRAKTGTLTGVSALAGVVRDIDGRDIVFAVIADQVAPDGRYVAERALDTIAGTIAGCGCR